MKPNGLFLVACSIFALALVGCGQTDQGGYPPAEGERGAMPAPADLREGIEGQLVRGELTNIDLEGKTLTVKAADGEHHFTFSDQTEVSGAASAQGLAGREGSWVSVHYRDDQGAKMATHIELESIELEPRK